MIKRRLLLVGLLLVFVSGCSEKKVVDLESREVLQEASSEIDEVLETKEEIETGELITEPPFPPSDNRERIVYDMTPKGGKKIEQKQMTYNHIKSVSQNDYSYYVYEDDGYNIEFVYKGMKEPSDFTINGKTVKLKKTQETSSSSGQPCLTFVDINKDGKQDIFFKWEGFNRLDYDVILSDGDGYKEESLSGEDCVSDIKFTLLKDYKVKVESKKYGIDQVCNIGSSFKQYRIWDHTYDYEGNLETNDYNMSANGAYFCLAEVEFYMVGSDAVIMVKQHYVDRHESLGASLIYEHTYNGNNNFGTKVKVVEENFDCR